MSIGRNAWKLALAALTLLGTGCAVETGASDQQEEAVGQTAAAVGATSISTHAPDGIVYSTGNVYFTSHVTGIRVIDPPVAVEREAALKISPILVTTATVYRTGKTSTPGQEGVLWSETGSRFGDIIWELVGGVYYGYFLSQNLSTNVVTIKRVPLAGGTAIDIVGPGGIGTNVDIVNGHHLLDSDGVNLYWQDDVSVRKMPIGGGAQTVLDATTPNTPTAGVHVVGANLIYANSSSVITVPTAGTTTPPSSRTIINTGNRITTTDAVAYGSNTMFAWGLQTGGAEFSLTGILLGIKGNDGFIPTSLAAGGGESFGFTACTNAACEIGGTLLGTMSVNTNAFGMSIDLSVPSVITEFWADSTGVHRMSGAYIQ